MKIIKNNLILICILGFSLFTKLLFLNQFPNGITNDELHFVLNSKSVFLNFSNLSNNWNPLSLTTIPQETSSELPFILMSPIIGTLPTNLFTARLFHTILGTLIILLLYLISLKIFNKQIAIAVAFISTLNPWIFYVYRTAFDAPISIFFIFLFITCLLYLSKNKVLLSFIPIFIAFYSYIGIKPIIFLVSIASSIFIYFFYHRQNLKNLVFLNILVLLTTIFYFLSLQTTSSRLGELVLPTSPTITSIVDTRRAQTTPNFLTPIYSNKYGVYLEFVASKWLNSFSPNLLLLKGDDTYTGSLQRHGYFYFFDLIFIIIGFYYLFKKHQKSFYFLVSLLIISPIPEAIRKDIIPAYVFHSSLQFPILTLIAGAGFYQIFSKYKLIAVIPLLSFLNLLFIYFFQYPNYAPESFSFNNRLLSEYLILEKLSSSKIYVVVKEPDTLFKSYLFYSNSLNSRTFSDISQIYQNRSNNYFDFNNIIFTTSDNKISPKPKDVVVVEEGVAYSPPHVTNKKVILNSNSQVIYNIFNSTSNYPTLRTAF